MPLSLARRQSAGIGLRQMARLLRISHAYLWDMERGYRPVRPEIARAYKAHLVKYRRVPRQGPRTGPALAD